ncbi:hypothetical protein Dimus_029765 [Dionaea muscipula]
MCYSPFDKALYAFATLCSNDSSLRFKCPSPRGGGGLEEKEKKHLMGQFLNKLAPVNDEKKAEEIAQIAGTYYQEHFSEDKKWSSTDFYRAVCEAVEQINKSIGCTQLQAPKATTLEKAYYRHHKEKGKSLTKEEFQKILEDVIIETRVTGVGAIRDSLFYIFGVPMAAVLFKRSVMPRAIPNKIFIPGVTSATVFVLAKLNKI